MIKNLFYEKPKFIACFPLIFILLESFCDNTFKCYNFTFFIFAVMIMFATQKDEILKLKLANSEKVQAKQEKKLKKLRFKNEKEQTTNIEKTDIASTQNLNNANNSTLEVIENNSQTTPQQSTTATDEK